MPRGDVAPPTVTLSATGCCNFPLPTLNYPLLLSYSSPVLLKLLVTFRLPALILPSLLLSDNFAISTLAELLSDIVSSMSLLASLFSSKSTESYRDRFRPPSLGAPLQFLGSFDYVVSSTPQVELATLLPNLPPWLLFPSPAFSLSSTSSMKSAGGDTCAPPNPLFLDNTRGLPSGLDGLPFKLGLVVLLLLA